MSTAMLERLADAVAAVCRDGQPDYMPYIRMSRRVAASLAENARSAACGSRPRLV